MKSQYALRQNQILTSQKTNLHIVKESPVEAHASILRRALKRIVAFVQGKIKTQDLDLESWQRIEFRGKSDELRDPRRIDLHRYF